MSVLNPTSVMQSLQDNTIKEVKALFPIEGKQHTLLVDNVYGGTDLDPDDIGGQKKARMRGRTWSTPVYGDFRLVDNASGKTLDTQRGVRVLALPKLTQRYSYIVDGTEYQADHQWRLKSGAYTRVKANGELETQFNLAKGRGFRMQFSPENRKFLMQYGTANVHLLPVLRALGVGDETVKAAVGPQLFDKLAKAKSAGELVKLAKALNPRAEVTTDEAAIPLIQEAYAATELREDTTKITLGAPFSSVTGGALLAAASRLLGVSRGTHEPDNRDALQFKELWSIEDHIPERIANSRRRILAKLRNNVDRRDKVAGVITPDVFGVPVKAFFTSTSMTQQPTQLNPTDMLGGFLRTTIMGTGGIQSDQAISDSAKMSDSSHMGFLDPVHTPEGARGGVTLHLTLGVEKKGLEPAVNVFNTKSKKFELRTPTELNAGNVAFADEYNFPASGAPVTRKPLVTVIPAGGGDPAQVSSDKVDFIMRSSKSMFSITANLVPFLPSDQANRAGMATRQMEQAIGLRDREEPLVQVVSGNPSPAFDTWEKVVGLLVSQRSKKAGTVLSVGADKITIRPDGDPKGTETVQLYDNFPLNDAKAFITSTALVKAGDHVAANQVVADTNFTKNGVLAMGTNLRVAYLPFKGLVFEDGIAISETAANKLTSEHLHKSRAFLDKGMQLGLKKYRANYPGVVSDDNAKKLDEDGVIKEGSVVHPGDVLMTVMQKTEPSAEQVLLRGIHKSLARPYKDRSVVWQKPYTGVVTDVVRNGKEVVAYIRTDEPADVGDKLTGRHGNKGIITAVIPDEEMPKDAKGEPMEILLNPSGVPGRINPGQVLETALAKVAHKTGQPYAISNFEPMAAKKIVHVKGHYRTVAATDGSTREVWVAPHDREVGYQEIVRGALAEHGVSETDELFDPDTGKSLGQILTGYQYVLKQVHQVDKKLSARSHGYGNDYDANLAPKSGGKAGGQRYGELGLYAMLAHGATANIRDSVSYSSDKAQDEVWTAIQAGQILPAPQPAFAYEKFLSYLNALGVNVTKDGPNLITTPMTNEQILSLSNGELKDGSKVIRGKDLRPEAGGLFDEGITGGPGGKNWSHIKLASSLPNPLFEKAVRALLGLTGAQYDSIIGGSSTLDAEGNVIPASATDKLLGPAVIAAALRKIDVKKKLAEEEEATRTAPTATLDKHNKRVRYLRMLDRTGLSADKAYTISNVPVIPPLFRPISSMEGGDLNVDGLNLLYRDVAILNQKVKEADGVLPEEQQAKLRADLYDAVDALMGVSSSDNSDLTLDGQARPPGLLTLLSGRSSPKESFFHKRLLNRRQDLTMRSVIVPDMGLSLDEVGLPRKGAMQIFRPFVVKELSKMGFTPLQARAEVEKNSPLAQRALEVAVSKRPVLFKRDPVLHKFGVLAFKPVLHDEYSIHIHPLVTGGFNADFDGDAMAVFVPVSQEAVDEAYGMMPSKNLFNPATGQVMYQPSLEGQLGLYLMSQFGKPTNKKYASENEAMSAAANGDISYTDMINIGGKRSTAGRAAIANTLPKALRTDELLTDASFVLGKKNLQSLMRTIATKSPAEFADTIDRIKNLGFGHAYNIGFSFSMKDFDTLYAIRDKHLAVADKAAAKLRATGVTGEALDNKLVELYQTATGAINEEAKKSLGASGNKLYTMNLAGVKPAWGQVQQLLLAPLLVENAAGRTIPVPVRNSYGEGLSSSGYWIASGGARKGLIEKVQSVQVPGALSKQIINTTISYVVSQDDCGTARGISLASDDRDLIDRFTAKPITIGKTTIAANTLITPNLFAKISASKASKIVARSPLKCEAPKGMCSKCYGAQDDGVPIQKGVNIGVIAGQAIGERGTQLSMKNFHTGGIAGAGSSVVGGIERISQILKLPQTLPNKATIATATGGVSAITPSEVGGWDVTVGNTGHYIPAGRTLSVKVGDKLEKGDRLSSGSIDPRELLAQTNIDTVQRYMTGEVHKVYASEGVKKRNVEVVIKALTNLGVVTDSGDSDSLLRGDYASVSYVNSLNRANKAGHQIKMEPVLRGVETMALDQTTDWLARLQYRKLKETYTRAASEGWQSSLHGTHPVPGITFGAEFGRKTNDESPY